MTLWQRIKNWWSPPPKTTPLTVVKPPFVKTMAKGGYYEGKKRTGSSSSFNATTENVSDIAYAAALHVALSSPTPTPSACSVDDDSLISSFASGVGGVCSAVGDVVSSTFE